MNWLIKNDINVCIGLSIVWLRETLRRPSHRRGTKQKNGAQSLASHVTSIVKRLENNEFHHGNSFDHILVPQQPQGLSP
jgi:hypothetical protein